MYANELLDAYKKAQNYVQDKQIAHDLNVEPNKISKMRNGIRYVTDEEAIFLAEGAGIEPEVALIGVHADRNENPRIRELWNNIAKKHNGLGLRGISMICIGLGLFTECANAGLSELHRCALCILC
ncbi:DUF3693 domain-containing protein [Vibrio vulnificus]|uniref:DUF3693 domain-containing protein n=1 Tax=Vibrio vulnificus TaxID=672 RepID=UPI000D3EB65E|nr:DUF3693 domain-containing protein [Vibrio vulnificus]MBN8141625.1 hypothetical protein [Vibrio vulnificus]MBN8150891.1 hypothetical protein [Vibrio vulnificus]NIG90192.1 hypothetical protein [Vibrio vulnificus]PUZ81474.1 hypothetical protein DC357_13630 [Vibrio vulnificus]HAU8251984.1 hypothetical protein [Vibrio vulnificus]